jgi:hypothetical protein
MAHAGAGPARRAVVVGLVACIGERVAPAPPAAGTSARYHWEELRRAEVLREIEVVRALRD